MDVSRLKTTRHAAQAVSGASLVGCEPATPQIEIPKDMPKPGTVDSGKATKG